MTKQIIKLDRKEIRKAIGAGDNCQGCRWLAVWGDGEHKVYWRDNNAPWNPWPDSASIVKIPALFPDGDDAEFEMCKEIARDKQIDWRKINAEVETGLVAYIENTFPGDYQEYIKTNLDWLADAFLALCNGDGSELKDLAPWGIKDLGESGIETIEPPFEFEYK